MESKHTPGPWTVYDDSNDGKTGRIEIAAIGKTVARIYNSVPAQDLPNALLMAAAPDLLEALSNLELSANTVQYCFDRRPENFGTALTQLTADAKRARDAIARARGEA
jgi:hypothetical protein